MEPLHPEFSSYEDENTPWRLVRLARVDGRVREIMRHLTTEPDWAESAMGEIVWAHHVSALHDDRGVLHVRITAELATSPWLIVVAAALSRAWDEEDEQDMVFVRADGRRIPLDQVLPPLMDGKDWARAWRSAGRRSAVSRMDR